MNIHAYVTYMAAAAPSLPPSLPLSFRQMPRGQSVGRHSAVSPPAAVTAMALFVRRKEKVPNANVDLPSLLLLLLLLSFPPSLPTSHAHTQSEADSPRRFLTLT